MRSALHEHQNAKVEYGTGRREFDFARSADLLHLKDLKTPRALMLTYPLSNIANRIASALNRARLINAATALGTDGISAIV